MRPGSTHKGILIVAAVTCILTGVYCAEGTRAAPSIDVPDLDVTFISQSPRYPTLHGRVAYLDHNKPYLTDPEAEKFRKFFPGEGENVTFTAHFTNKGAEFAGEIGYAWKIDETVVETGRVKAPRHNEVAEKSIEWQWQDGPHTVTFELDPEGKIKDFVDWNNRKTDRTDALGFHFCTTRETYDRWNANKSFLGSYSFEDWVNWHFDEMNREFEAAVYPSTPNGCLERVRMDTFAVAETPEAIGKLDRANYSGYWSFHAPEGEGWVKEDMALIHELGHQIGLVDYYLIVYGLYGNQLPNMYGQPCMEGYVFPQAGGANMFSPGARKWCEASVVGLNRQKGYPRGYYGTYLFDHADRYSIRILDREGNPVPHAKVTYYRHKEGLRKEQEGTTDRQGIMPLKNYDDVDRYKIPHSPFEIKPTPFGKIRVVGVDSILCFHVLARDQEDFAMTDTTQFIIANACAGQHKHVVVDIKTRIGASAGPMPPRNANAEWRDMGTALIRWETPENDSALTYNVFIERFDRLWSQQFKEPAIVAEGIEAHELVYNYTGDPDKSSVRFYVTAVDKDGHESAPSRKLWLPYPPKKGVPVQIIYEPARDRLITSGTTRLNSYAGETGFLPISWFMATRGLAFDSYGCLLVAMPGSGAVNYYDPGLWMDTYAPRTCNGIADRGAFKDPQDMAIDGRGFLVVAETGAGRVVVVSIKKDLVAELGGEGDNDGRIVRPLSVAILPDRRIAVGDAELKQVVLCRINGDGSASYSTLPGEFGNPIDMAVDSHGNLIVVDAEQGSVRVFSGPEYSRGKVVAQGLSNPTSAAIEKNGALVVYDSGKEGMDRFVRLEGILPKDSTYHILSVPKEKVRSFSVVSESMAGRYDPLIVLEDWHVVGAFPNTAGNGFDTVYPPETEKEFDFSRKYQGIYGEIGWKMLPPIATHDGELISFLACFSPANFACAYAATTVYSDRERKAGILTGSDDTITMWVNGEKVLSKNIQRGIRKDEDRTEVTLKKGENRLLIKVCQGIGGWHLYFRIVDPETGEELRLWRKRDGLTDSS